MNNVAGLGGWWLEEELWVCLQKKKEGQILHHHPSLLLFPFSSPSPGRPNPPVPSIHPPARRHHLAALQKVRARGERAGKEAERQSGGVGWLDVEEHAERRAPGRAMTAMLSPKIRQTRRGTFVYSHLDVPATCLTPPATPPSRATADGEAVALGVTYSVFM